MRIAYSYWMKDDPDRIRMVAPKHATYWRDLGLPAYLGGPFADRSGGLITFEAESVETAEGIIAADPFVREELLESSVVKHWMPEQTAAERTRTGGGVERRPGRSAATSARACRSVPWAASGGDLGREESKRRERAWLGDR